MGIKAYQIKQEFLAFIFTAVSAAGDFVDWRLVDHNRNTIAAGRALSVDLAKKQIEDWLDEHPVPLRSIDL